MTKGHFSELQVLRSHNGFYVGTVFIAGSISGYGSRRSDYFAKQSDAQAELERLTTNGGAS
jgi:dsRNA-specific ribonuclease